MLGVNVGCNCMCRKCSCVCNCKMEHMTVSLLGFLALIKLAQVTIIGNEVFLFIERWKSLLMVINPEEHSRNFSVCSFLFLSRP